MFGRKRIELKYFWAEKKFGRILLCPKKNLGQKNCWPKKHLGQNFCWPPKNSLGTLTEFKFLIWCQSNQWLMSFDTIPVEETRRDERRDGKNKNIASSAQFNWSWD